MADKLSATILAALQQHNVTVQQKFSAWVYRDGLPLTDISEYIVEYSDPSEFELFNRHPAETGRIAYPTLEVEVDNSSGKFHVGASGGVFPGGYTDFNYYARLRVRVTLEAHGVSQIVSQCDGYLTAPEYMHNNLVRLFMEHELAIAAVESWNENHEIQGSGFIRPSVYLDK